MAKRKAVVKKGEKVNVSAAIRAVVESGIESPKEIVAALAAKGIETSTAMASQVKGKMKAASGGSGKKGKGGGSLITAMEFVDAAGGFKAARALIDEAEEVSKLAAKLGR